MRTQRSTSGAYMCMRGPNTCFPIAAGSKRQGCIVLSTAEAELYAGFFTLRMFGIPAVQFWSTVLQREFLKLYFHPWVVLVVVHSHPLPPVGRRHQRRRRHNHHRRRPSTLSTVAFSLASRLSSPQPSRAVVWVSCLVRLEIPDSRCISYRRVDADAKVINPKYYKRSNICLFFG